MRDLGLDPATVVDHVTGEPTTLGDDAVQLPPYGSLWLTVGGEGVGVSCPASSYRVRVREYRPA